MPTSFASNATAPRILSASRPSASSASGSGAPVKVILQDQLGGDLVAHGLALAAARAGGAQFLCRDLSREALVAAYDGPPEALFELARESQRSRRHGMSFSIGVHRQPDDEQHRLPFLDQRGDCPE